MSIRAMSVVCAGALGVASAAEVPVHYDWLGEDGRLRGGFARIPADPPVQIDHGAIVGIERLPFGDLAEGPGQNRVRTVYLGDGYLENELAHYAHRVQVSAQQVFAAEPLRTYEPLFEVFRVDIVSNESGVSHDPTFPLWRNTALGMRYWCNDIERLLCVNTNAARAFAQAATSPAQPDLIIALANSNKYGGAGYPSLAIGTAAANNSAASQIIIHEIGHALGKLADEYNYGGPTVYTGREPAAPNSSIYTAQQQLAGELKWHRWIGENIPALDGVHSTFEGSSYSEEGVYRPTNNSMMRSLNRPFNAPSAEALVIEIYKIVRPIDAVFPEQGAVAGCQPLSVTPVQPFDHALDIEWFADGVPLAFSGSTLDPCDPAFGLSGSVLIEAVVTDNTEFVRDPEARDLYLTDSASWTVDIPAACPADLNGDGVVDADDFFLFLQLFATGDPLADFNGDGVIDADDFFVYLAAFAQGC
ncbi:MAG: hypothetical protein JJU33_08435 [Phycisphaerales bacterium]|nr:hypothetical protein [Phycisphaerales bacterium]